MDPCGTPDVTLTGVDTSQHSEICYVKSLVNHRVV